MEAVDVSLTTPLGRHTGDLPDPRQQVLLEAAAHVRDPDGPVLHEVLVVEPLLDGDAKPTQQIAASMTARDYWCISAPEASSSSFGELTPSNHPVVVDRP